MIERPDQSKEPHSDETSLEAWWRGASAWLIWAHPYHRTLFVGLNVTLTAVNIYMGAPWWALWPLLVTGLFYTVHYLIYASATVDDAWVEERAADLYDKSYDQGHISAIARQHELETAADRRYEARRVASEKAWREQRLRDERRKQLPSERSRDEGAASGKPNDKESGS
jgi:hypothetical protein